VTHIHTVPTVLRLMLRAVEERGMRLPRLRLCFVSGEALPLQLARQFHEVFRGAGATCELVNIWGCTECLGAHPTSHPEHRV
jgi:D-alanine--poly(phosphoribitol) ligase subunit 1